MKKIKQISILIILTALLLITCDTFYNQDAADTGKVFISLGGISRTIYPTIVFDSLEFTFKNENTGETAGPFICNEDEEFVFPLEYGTWRGEVNAIIDGVTAATGVSPVFTISAANPSARINIPLKEAAPGYGAGHFKYYINFPEGAEVTSMTLKKLPEAPWDGEILNIPSSVNVDSKTLAISGEVKNIPSGFYLFTVIMEKDDLTAGRSNVVHIYNLMTSEFGTEDAPRIFDNKDFVNMQPLKLITVKANGNELGEGRWITLLIEETIDISVIVSPESRLVNIDWVVSNDNVTLTTVEGGAVIKAGSVPGSIAVITVTASNLYNKVPAKAEFIIEVVDGKIPDVWTDEGGTPFLTTDTIYALAYGNGKFAAGSSLAANASGSGKIRHSSDGVSWNESSGTFFNIRAMTFSDYNGGRFVAGDASGNSYYSTDGVNWSTAKSAGTGGLVLAIASGDGKLAAVGYGIAYSEDGGENWTSVAWSGTTRGIAYGNGVWVVVGNSGKIGYSTNLTAWTEVTGVTTSNFQKVIFGNGKFVAVGESGIMFYSTDGQTWNEITNKGFTTSNVIYALGYGNGYFIAASGSIIEYSHNGIDWTRAQTSFGSSTIWSVIYGGSRWIAGSANGKIGFAPEYLGDIDQLFVIDKYEFRAAWVSTVYNLDFAAAASETAFRTAYNSLLDIYEDWKMNAVIFQVRPLLDAWYTSTINPWSQYIRSGSGNNVQGREPGFDPLAIMVEETHKRSLEFHAWFNPYRVTNTSYGNNSSGVQMPSDTLVLTTGKTVEELDTMPNRDAVDLLLAAYRANNTLAANNWAVNNPDKVYRFVGNNYRRIYLDAGHPGVRDHIVASIKEVIENYDVDAIHFDDYFYPYDATIANMAHVDQLTFETYGIGKAGLNGNVYITGPCTDPNGWTKCAVCLDRERWWRDNNTKMVQAVKAAIRAENTAKGKSIQFGISPFGVWDTKLQNPLGSDTNWGQYTYTNGVYADTRLWVVDQMIDYMVPQLYWDMNQSTSPYGVLAKWWNDIHQGKNVHLYIGHGNYRYQDSPSDSAWNNPREILDQIDFNKEQNLTNIKGSIFFRFANLKVTDTAAAGRPGILAQSNALLKENWSGHIALVPPKPWLNGAAAAAPAAIQNGNIITWASSADARYYVVYRITSLTPGSADANAVIKDASKIIGKVWNSGGTLTFTDTVPNPARYRYIVTAVNSAHVESAPVIAVKQ